VPLNVGLQVKCSRPV